MTYAELRAATAASVLPAKRGVLRPRADLGPVWNCVGLLGNGSDLNRCSIASMTRASGRSPPRQTPVDWSQTYAASNRCSTRRS